MIFQLFKGKKKKKKLSSLIPYDFSSFNTKLTSTKVHHFSPRSKSQPWSFLPWPSLTKLLTSFTLHILPKQQIPKTKALSHHEFYSHNTFSLFFFCFLQEYKEQATPFARLSLGETFSTASLQNLETYSPIPQTHFHAPQYIKAIFYNTEIARINTKSQPTQHSAPIYSQPTGPAHPPSSFKPHKNSSQGLNNNSQVICKEKWRK